MIKTVRLYRQYAYMLCKALFNKIAGLNLWKVLTTSKIPIGWATTLNTEEISERRLNHERIAKMESVPKAQTLLCPQKRSNYAVSEIPALIKNLIQESCLKAPPIREGDQSMGSMSEKTELLQVEVLDRFITDDEPP
ncbi:hypothetical protein EAE96_010823 [Botrytis aclada]|nr:hypothetical protein EAE96_010823 [Botrytis aclada]